MDARYPSTNDIRRNEPRLDYLIRLPDVRRDHRHRIFNGDALDRRVHQGPDKVQRFRLLGALVFEPSCAADREVGAWRMGNHQVPSFVENRTDVALEMRVPRFQSATGHKRQRRARVE